MSKWPMRGHFRYLTSRPFQWHQEHLNARCFGPCCWTLNIRESRRTPNPHFSKCWASPPHLAKVGLRHEETHSSETLWKSRDPLHASVIGENISSISILSNVIELFNCILFVCKCEIDEYVMWKFLGKG
jgi:hypothetical protein